MIDRVGFRARIAGGSILIAALLALVAGLVINAQIQRIVRDGTIDVLRSDSAFYETAIKNEPGENFDKPGPNQLVAVVDPGGDVPLSTLPDALRTHVPELLHDDETRDYVIDGEHFIVRAVWVKSGHGTFHVIAARTAEAEEVILSQMRTLLVTGLTVIVVAVGLTAWVLTGASLAPVRRLRATAERLSGEESTELLPVTAARDDLHALAVTLNGLITRLRDSADRERQLVSDASHELRTPLAILRTQLDAATASPVPIDPADLDPVKRSADRLSALLISLLELSRIESPGASPETTEVEILIDELDEAVERAGYRLGSDSRIQVQRQVDRRDHGRVELPISPEDLGRIADNLIGNAITAIDDARGGVGEIVVESRVDDQGLEVVVRDTGGGMPHGFVTHAADRFTRAQTHRARSGAGLGLSIVAALVRRSGGELELRNDEGEGLTVAVTLPADRATLLPSPDL